MKILHTSDWHIGQTLYSFDRFEDHRHALAQMTEIARSERPDAFIVSGDIFHTGAPSIQAQKLLSEALIGLRSACPDMTIVLTAGNHDSASRHEIHSSLWRRFDIHTVGTLSGGDTLEECFAKTIIPVGDKGWIIAVPFCHPRSLPEGFFAEAGAEVERRNTRGLPVVMMAHTFVTGSSFAGHDNADDRMVGGIDSVGLDTFGSGYDYLALGHIHKPQTLRGSGGRACYSGSPLAVSFDEAYPHHVNIVEIDAHGAQPRVVPVAIEPLCPLVTVGGPAGKPWLQAYDELERLVTDTSADRALRPGSYIRLNVALSGNEALPPQADTTAASLVCDHGHRFCLLNVVRASVADAVAERRLSVGELKKIDPAELVADYAGKRGKTFTDDMAALLREVCAAVDNDLMK